MNNTNLGRGLGSLISSTPQSNFISKSNEDSGDLSEKKVGSLYYVPTGKIVPNPYQPRLDFKHEELEQLSESIKKYGILAPLLVSKKDDGYQLIAGERRWQAATLIDLKEVPVIIRSATDLEKLELSLLENLQRENLNPIEEALAYKKFIDEFSMTQEQVADRVDKSRSTVANIIRLLNLPNEIQLAVRAGNISLSQAKVILSVEDVKEQKKLFRRIIKNGMTVRQTRRATNDFKKILPVDGSDLEVSANEEVLRNYLDTRIKIEKTDNGGRLIIDYYSPAELKRIIDKIVG